ncbi:hypothetical protein B0T19DRAFT_226784 [Cercophora scortea]|uniref:Uncharacterized protein n=1 Tax=Cercophora scortea TaxID=314031 RepID=A0AAE0MAT4_9PEZI|nr:hypothetical protein B0T19DRAFT_226784 [Cercophora scortea]
MRLVPLSSSFTFPSPLLPPSSSPPPSPYYTPARVTPSQSVPVSLTVASTERAEVRGSTGSHYIRKFAPFAILWSAYVQVTAAEIYLRARPSLDCCCLLLAACCLLSPLYLSSHLWPYCTCVLYYTLRRLLSGPPRWMTPRDSFPRRRPSRPLPKLAK